MNIVKSILINIRDSVHRLTLSSLELKSLKESGRLSRFHNIHKDEDCFIIGNGPSLKDINMDLLLDYYTFATNKIYLLFDSFKWRPTYYVCMDAEVMKQSASLYNNFNFIKFLYLDGAVRHHLDINSKDTFLISMGTPFDFAGFKKNFSKIGHGYTVTYAALQIAFYMGFKNVFLIGVDHKYKHYGEDRFKINASFEENHKILTKDDNDHFHPDYFKNQIFPKPNLVGSEIAYRISKMYYEENGRKIYDATQNGALNVFEKISFTDALSLCKKIS